MEHVIFKPKSPKVSSVVKKIVSKDNSWRLQAEEFAVAPANGIRGYEKTRKRFWMQHDDNLRLLFQNHQIQIAAGNADIQAYLRNVSHHLGN
jgi:hypothetical protein